MARARNCSAPRAGNGIERDPFLTSWRFTDLSYIATENEALPLKAVLPWLKRRSPSRAPRAATIYARTVLRVGVLDHARD